MRCAEIELIIILVCCIQMAEIAKRGEVTLYRSCWQDAEHKKDCLILRALLVCQSATILICKFLWKPVVGLTWYLPALFIAHKVHS